MVREQTFVVTIERPYKDDCGELVEGFTPGDIRSALWRQLPIGVNSINVLERGDLEEVKGE